jgi:hypothetical protein
MTERPSQQKQILDKLEDLSVRLARIETKIEMQPIIDAKEFDGLKQANASYQSSNSQRFKTIEGRIDAHDQNTTWIVRVLISELLGIVMFAIYALFK